MSTKSNGVPVLTVELAHEMIIKGEQDIEMFRARADAPGYVGEINRRLIVEFEADIARLRAFIATKEKQNEGVHVKSLVNSHEDHLRK